MRINTKTKMLTVILSMNTIQASSDNQIFSNDEADMFVHDGEVG